jgi:hypothetical protein
MEILIKNEGNTWLSFHIFKYWFKILDRHTIELADSACVSLFEFMIYTHHNYEMYATAKCYGSLQISFHINVIQGIIVVDCQAFVADYSLQKW